MLNVLKNYLKFEIFDPSLIDNKYVVCNPNPEVFQYLTESIQDFIHEYGDLCMHEFMCNSNKHVVDYISANDLCEVAADICVADPGICVKMSSCSLMNDFKRYPYKWNSRDVTCLFHINDDCIVKHLFETDIVDYDPKIHNSYTFVSSCCASTRSSISINAHSTIVKFLINNTRYIDIAEFHRNTNEIAVDFCEKNFDKYRLFGADNESDAGVRRFIKKNPLPWLAWQLREASANPNKIMFWFVVKNNLIEWSSMSKNPNVLAEFSKF